MLKSGINTIMLTASANSSFVDKLPRALSNTLIGVGVVFVVLIGISIIISLIKYVPTIVNSFQQKDSLDSGKEQNQGINNNSYNNIALEEELVQDTELVAVITAAIMAYMGENAPADGLVVRSIRKVNRKNWQNA